jgi:very-short-patch-repair endonuclease
VTQCAICGKDFKRNSSLAVHVKITHGMDYLSYSILYNNFEKPICVICGGVAEYTGRGLKFKVTCDSGVCSKKHRNNRVCSNVTKEKIRKKRFKYLKKRLGETAWERRTSGKMSYLEQWFFDEVITKHNLLTKFDIINEYPEYPYFIDFAFLNIRIAVEIDGKQHFRNKKNQDRDTKKQKVLMDKGWKVYRIRFDALNENTVKEFLCIISNPTVYRTKILEPKLFKFYSYKKIKSDERSKKIKEAFYKKEKNNIDKVRNSNIDFSKFGWVTQISKIIDKQPQRINRWMKRYCPEILDKAFKRGFLERKIKNPIPFSEIEKVAKEKGYFIDGNDIKNKRGKTVKKHVILGYPCISISVGGKIKHLRLHRFKAYLMFGDKIYEKGTKVVYKTEDKYDISESNISLKRLMSGTSPRVMGD